jgi:fructose-1,6-bisphosphatase/inositol monophosphatase family enzyme
VYFFSLSPPLPSTHPPIHTHTQIHTNTDSYPLIAVSIALAIHQHVVVSVIYLPTSDNIYTATKGGGAFRNNHPIHISHAQTIGEALLVNNIGSSRSNFFISHTLTRLHSLLAHHNLQGLRMSGSACVNLAHVSDGKIDVYIEDGYGGVWDVAAGSLLVTEAGGVCVCVDGSPWKLHLGKGACVVGGKEVVEEIVEKVRRADRWYWFGKVWGWVGTGAVGVCVGLLVVGGMKGRRGGR